MGNQIKSKQVLICIFTKCLLSYIVDGGFPLRRYDIIALSRALVSNSISSLQLKDESTVCVESYAEATDDHALI